VIAPLDERQQPQPRRSVQTTGRSRQRKKSLNEHVSIAPRCRTHRATEREAGAGRRQHRRTVDQLRGGGPRMNVLSRKWLPKKLRVLRQQRSCRHIRLQDRAERLLDAYHEDALWHLAPSPYKTIAGQQTSAIGRSLMRLSVTGPAGNAPAAMSPPRTLASAVVGDPRALGR
jgi:hypothetical protein